MVPNIFLHNDFTSKQFSTKEPPSEHCLSHRSVNSNRSSRVREFSTHQRKAFNMNDSERRIKRECHPLFLQSTQQSALFEKGLKKMQCARSEQKPQKTIHRSYRNNESGNILQPISLIQNKIITGGVRKIDLYDQRKQSSQKTSLSTSKKRFLKNRNQTHVQENDYYIRRLPNGHDTAGWGNSHVGVRFAKKENMINRQNLNSSKQLGEKKTIKLTYKKNKSNLDSKQSGLVTKREGNKKAEKLGIDFNQEYFRQKSALHYQLGSTGYSRAYR